MDLQDAPFTSPDEGPAENVFADRPRSRRPAPSARAERGGSLVGTILVGAVVVVYLGALAGVFLGAFNKFFLP